MLSQSLGCGTAMMVILIILTTTTSHAFTTPTTTTIPAVSTRASVMVVRVVVVSYIYIHIVVGNSFPLFVLEKPPTMNATDPFFFFLNDTLCFGAWWFLENGTSLGRVFSHDDDEAYSKSRHHGQNFHIVIIIVDPTTTTQLHHGGIFRGKCQKNQPTSQRVNHAMDCHCPLSILVYVFRCSHSRPFLFAAVSLPMIESTARTKFR